MAEANYPSATKVCKWTDPSTGQQTEFALQHALDFAYYVDGGVTPVPPAVGQAFCCPPQSQSPIGGGDGEEREGSELFDPFIDDDDTPQDQSEPIREGTVQVTTRPERPKRSRQPVSPSDNGVHEAKRRRTAVDQDALIVEKFSDDPELLERFLVIRQANRQSQMVPRTQVSTSSEMIGQPPPRKRVTVASNYAFAPRDDQQEVHERVTSENHKGKPATIFVKSMARSKFVKFKALPVVCTRAYDIQFGSGGLSIRHFARLSEDERMSWLESGGSNFGNLSATAELAAATPASRIEDVVEAARVFLTYCREYCCSDLIELVEHIVEFIEETLMRVSWSQKELSTLVYWVNDVLEDFRSVAESDGDLRQVMRRCSTDDRLLRDLMFVKVHQHVSEIKNERLTDEARTGGTKRAPNYQFTPRQGGKRRLGRISRGVLRQLPVQTEPGSGKAKSLCMRYLSKAGCAPDANGACSSDHGYFGSNKLPACVKEEITR
ncbi:hypothetical protein GN958_ATG06920 [Phytophthora infestans]|uniref:Uncharacterized protein n=1 Tax=Phytophthora infestans TaxID=4787 RepID=A0A8S9UXH7_PHYIN|nr:hypothetical protein GN958_ATG06920 [Phytophthora infestans]